MWSWLTGQAEEENSHANEEPEEIIPPEEGAGTPECPTPSTPEEYEQTLQEAKQSFLAALDAEDWNDMGYVAEDSSTEIKLFDRVLENSPLHLIKTSAKMPVSPEVKNVPQVLKADEFRTFKKL